MVTLKSLSGEVEVRVQKACDGVAEPGFFQEYAKLGVHEPDGSKATLYIVPEKTTYAILVTLKKGFKFGEYSKVWVTLTDEATQERIFNESYPRACENDTLEQDQRIFIDTADLGVVVDGEERRNVKLTFQNVSPGNR